MAVKDSYSEWLGVTTPDRPPNHYQLLGLEESESSRERIEEAARRQIEKLRQHERGDPSERETAERLLLEVQRAQYVLTHPQRKDEYDRWLQETREKGTPKSIHLSLVAAVQELITRRDLAVEKRQWEHAAELARKLVNTAPDDPDHKQALEFIQAQAARTHQLATVKKSAKSVAVVMVLIGVVILAVTLVRQLSTEEEENAGTRGEALEAEGDWSSAREAYKDAVEKGDEKARPRVEAMDCIVRAEELLENKQYAEALVEYKRALKSVGNRAALQERIRSLERKLDYAREQALERAGTAEGHGDWQAATQAYQDLIALGASDKETQARLEAMQTALKAEELEKSGKYEEALAAYKEVVDVLANKSEIERRMAELEKQIAATRPRIRY